MYSGTLVGGGKVGTGVFTFACRDVYTGEFVNDAIDGYGVYSFAEQGTYGGQVSKRSGCWQSAPLLALPSRAHP